MSNERVSAKISHLRHEGKPQSQAVAMALSMERAGRLGPGGAYRRVGRKSKKSSKRKSIRSGGRR